MSINAKPVYESGLLPNLGLNAPYSVAPLDGKYYGTIIVDADGNEFLKIWGLGHDEYPWHPSRRIDDPYDDMFCDSHWESAEDLALAEYIAWLLNSLSRNK